MTNNSSSKVVNGSKCTTDADRAISTAIRPTADGWSVESDNRIANISNEVASVALSSATIVSLVATSATTSRLKQRLRERYSPRSGDVVRVCGRLTATSAYVARRLTSNDSS
ncbi:MAG: hypothetical protein IIV91_02730 [Alistipes sp.]|nr:hypothetical protein [Alistipes sp.]